MNPQIVLLVISCYFLMLFLISWFTSRKITADTFFTGDRQSPWFLVAFGMIGASLSGVTFISVPGEVGNSNFYYFQVVLGYTLGYFTIAKVLLPLYYRLNLVSIYSYLEDRFGFWSYKTGAFFFILSRTLGSSLRVFLVASVLQLILFDSLGIPFWVSVLITVGLIWLYTHRGGIKTVLIPEDNKKDLIEIPNNIKNKLKIIPVSSIDEVISHALVDTPQVLSILEASKIIKNERNDPDKTSFSH